MNVKIVWQLGDKTTILEDFGPISPYDYTISNMHHWLSRHDYWSIKKCCEGNIMLIIGIYYEIEEEEEYGWFCKHCNEYVEVLEDKKVHNLEYCSKCNSVVVFYIQKKEEEENENESKKE